LWAVCGTALLGIVLCAGVVAWWTATGGRGFGPRSAVRELPFPEDASPQQKYAAVAAAFNADAVGVSPARLRRIQALFDRVVKATAADDDAAFARLIDTELLLAEMTRSGHLDQSGFAGLALDAATIQEQLWVPACWTRYKIVHVDLHANRDAAIVYALFWDGNGSELPVRWWIVRDGAQQWKAYDWELLDYGIRASAEEAIFYGYGDDSRLQAYDDCKTDLVTARDLLEQGEYDRAAETIRGTEELSILPVFRDDAWLQIGHTWSQYGDENRALACYRRVADPEAAPGTLYGLARCYLERGSHEEALRQISRYESLLGRNADVAELKGQSLLALGRRKEAAVELRKSLDCNPQQIDTLLSLAGILRSDEKEALVQYVQKTDDPVETALSVAQRCATSEDSAGLAAMARWIAQRQPDAAVNDFLAGLACQLDGDEAGAAAAFKTAWGKETDADKKNRYRSRYLEMILGGGGLLAGYTDSPDPEETFEYLADSYISDDYDISKKAFVELLDAHRRRCPDDPWIRFYAGYLLAYDEKYADAEKEYAAGMAATEDEEILQALRCQRIWVLHESGQDLQAYRTIEPPEETFEQLIRYYRWLDELDAEQVARLQSLIEAHRARFPDDPWLDYCSALLAEVRKDYAEADRLLVAARNRTTDEELQSACDRRRRAIRLKSGEIVSALDEIEPADETFEYLADNLIAEQRWADLASLLSAYRRIDPSSADILCRQAEMAWQQEDYRRVIQLAAPWPPSGADELDPWESKRLCDHLVRSQLRVGRTQDARATAEAFHEQSGEPDLLVLVCAAAGDVGGTTKLMTQLLPRQYLIAGLYGDQDVGHLLRSEKFLPLRRVCPPSLQYYGTDTSVLLLLKESRPPDVQQLRSALSAALLAEPTIKQLPSTLPDDPAASFVLATPEWTCRLTFGRDRYFDEESEPAKPKDRAVQQALADHKAWIAVNVAAMGKADSDSRLQTTFHAAAALLEDDVLAVYLDSEGRLLSVADADVLRLDRPREELATMGEAVWLYRQGAFEEENEQRSTVKIRRDLRTHVTLADESDLPMEVRVKVRLQTAFASEIHWLAVERIRHGEYGSITLFGRLLTDSVLWPELCRDEPLCVGLYEVLDWKPVEVPLPKEAGLNM